MRAAMAMEATSALRAPVNRLVDIESLGTYYFKGPAFEK